MTHSPVYYDEAREQYVVLVAHEMNENEILMPRDWEDDRYSYGGALIGLMEYTLDTDTGDLYIFDPDDQRVYFVEDIEDWEGLDKSAVSALLSAADGEEAVDTIDAPGYKAKQERYMDGSTAKEALLGKHGVGTVVRIDYGHDSPELVDIAMKVGWDYWTMLGVDEAWTDEEIEAKDYEVIYHA